MNLIFIISVAESINLWAKRLLKLNKFGKKSLKSDLESAFS
jgi:hypothetical protein